MGLSRRNWGGGEREYANLAGYYVQHCFKFQCNTLYFNLLPLLVRSLNREIDQPAVS